MLVIVDDQGESNDPEVSSGETYIIVKLYQSHISFKITANIWNMDKIMTTSDYEKAMHQ